MGPEVKNEVREGSLVERKWPTFTRERLPDFRGEKKGD